MKSLIALARWVARTVSIVLLVLVGSTLLVRFAPGYLSDAREMDARYAGAARVELATEAAKGSLLPHMLSSEIRGWMHGDAGVSRQYGVPVSELILPRLSLTGGLLLRSLGLAWTLAACASILTSTGRNPSLLWQAPATFLLAVPTAAMATLCLVSGRGGPVAVMGLLLAARDFKFIHRALRKAWMGADILQARAQGIRTCRLLWRHVLPSLASQLSALASLSIVTALSALVPVEVVFNLPGLGQLAWNAALNRDLPVLLAVTTIMALAVMFAGIASDYPAEWKRV